MEGAAAGRAGRLTVIGEGVPLIVVGDTRDVPVAGRVGAGGLVGALVVAADAGVASSRRATALAAELVGGLGAARPATPLTREAEESPVRGAGRVDMGRAANRTHLPWAT